MLIRVFLKSKELIASDMNYRRIFVLILVLLVGHPLPVAAQNPSVLPWEKTSKKIDVLDFKDVDVHDVLKVISQKTGVNIVAGHAVKGKITVYLKSIELEDALKTILESHGWAYIEEDNVIKVLSNQEFKVRYGYDFGRPVVTRVKPVSYAKAADLVAMLNQLKNPSGKVISDASSNTLVLIDTPEKIKEMEYIIDDMDVALETEVFQLSYATVKDLADKINEILTPQLGRMKYDDRSNKLIVTDVQKKVQEVQALVEAFDVKEKEVFIEAKILQITLNDEFKMGIDWDAIVSDYQDLNLKSNFDVLSSVEKRGQISVGTLSSDDFSVVLNALETVGETNILSSPRITVLNNKEAKILVGSNEPYVTSTTTTTASGPTTTAESVNFIDVGVKLFVTPTIHEDDFITMKIKPEISSKVDIITTSNNNTIPIVETSEAETTVTIKNGTGIIIGGLIKEETIEISKQVPVLSQIPVFGLAFKSRSDMTKKTEIIIFLTPQIITGEGYVGTPWIEQDVSW
ncbi:MAG: hypothetical protein K8S27_13425 [Candidatus Omnitrophica bacterium]|nr:hypothetical protein [Candidatus Omnitrophota bacterium]